MSDQRALVRPSRENLFRSLQEGDRTVRILQLAASRNLVSLFLISLLAFAIGTVSVALVIAQRNYDRSTVRVEILSRLLANEVQQDVQTALPFYRELAKIGADTLALEAISPQAFEQGRRQMLNELANTTASAAAILRINGDLAFEAGTVSALPFIPTLPELQNRNIDALQPSFAVFHTPQPWVDGRYMVPISIALDDPELGSAYSNARGYLIMLVPDASFARTLEAFLPDPGRYAGFLIDETGRVLISTRLDADMLPKPGEQFALETLQGARSSLLDQDVSVFASEIAGASTRGLGSEWVGAFATVPGQQSTVLVLDATDPVSLVLGEGATLVLIAIIPGIFVILLFSYIVTNTWLSQDNSVRDLQSWVARYRVATNLLRSGVIEWFPNEGDVMLAGSWKALLGYRNAEIANDIDQWHERIHPDDKVRVLTRLQDMMDGKMLRSEQRYRLEDRDTGYLTIMERAAVEKWPSGQVRRVILVHSLISNSK